MAVVVVAAVILSVAARWTRRTSLSSGGPYDVGGEGIVLAEWQRPPQKVSRSSGMDESIDSVDWGAPTHYYPQQSTFESDSQATRVHEM